MVAILSPKRAPLYEDGQGVSKLPARRERLRESWLPAFVNDAQVPENQGLEFKKHVND